MDAVLANMQNSTEGTNVQPTGVVCVDSNGLALGAAPEGEAAHAGAFRNIVKGVSDLQQLEMEDYAPQQQHQEAERQELPGNPVCLVQSNDSSIVMCERRNGVIVAVKVDGSKGHQNS